MFKSNTNDYGISFRIIKIRDSFLITIWCDDIFKNNSMGYYSEVDAIVSRTFTTLVEAQKSIIDLKHRMAYCLPGKIIPLLEIWAKNGNLWSCIDKANKCTNCGAPIEDGNECIYCGLLG